MAKCIHLGSVTIIGGESFCRYCGDVEDIDKDPFDMAFFRKLLESRV